MTENKTWDFTVIGGGIVGLATAYRLYQQQPNAQILILEKESELGRHQTSHNSGVIHSGIYYRPGSAKVENCLQGYRDLLQFCQEQNVAYELCGKLIVATEEKELKGLEALYERGQQHGLSNLKLLSADKLKEQEPYLKGLKGLHIPQTGIIDFTEVANSLAKLLQSYGVSIRSNCCFLGLKKSSQEMVIETTSGSFKTRFLINCAGLQLDRVATLCGHQTGLKILPFRGEYFLLKSDKKFLVKNLIYPVPNPEFPFLGVHFTRSIHGDIDVGPNAVLALAREEYTRTAFNISDAFEIFTWPGTYHIFRKYWREGLNELARSYSKKIFVKSLQRFIPDVTENDLEPYRPGIRAQACDLKGNLIDDFRFFSADRELHVLNAPSPAATSAFSIGRHVVKTINP